MPGGVLAHQPGTHDGAVGVDDPAARSAAAALVRVGVGEMLLGPAIAEDRGAPPHARLRQIGTDHRQASRTEPLGEVTSISPSKPSRRTASKSIPGAHFHHCGPAPVDIGQPVQRRGVSARIEPAPAPAAAGRVEQHARRAVAGGDRGERVGAAQRRPRARGCAGPWPAGPRRCRCRSVLRRCRAAPPTRSPIEQVASCTTGPASRRARWRATAAAVACCSASSVNSQSRCRDRRTWRPPGGAAGWSPPAPRRARRSGSGSRPRRPPGSPRSARTPPPRPARRAGVPAQVGDVGAGERQEGLTPVIMTL